MGLDRTIRFPAGVPSWESIQAALARLGESAPLRMIDGMPAFPDEVPDPGWKELRVGFASGMVTLRRMPDTLMCVVWGNADSNLRQSWDKLTWAAAVAGDGLILTADGGQSAENFAASIGLSIQ